MVGDFCQTAAARFLPDFFSSEKVRSQGRIQLLRSQVTFCASLEANLEAEFVDCNPCQSSPSLTIFVSLCVNIISSLLSYLYKLIYYFQVSFNFLHVTEYSPSKTGEYPRLVYTKTVDSVKRAR